MPRKKLRCYQIMRVDELPKESPRIGRVLQQVSLDVLRDPRDSADGTFIKWLDTLILPKRKRGTKFRATYTEIFQKEL